MNTIEEFIKELNEKFPKRNTWSNSFDFTEGSRFWKIISVRTDEHTGKIYSRSAYGFVDKATGDLYKAASWNAPAKHVRGNINDESGLAACDEYSVKYLR